MKFFGGSIVLGDVPGDVFGVVPWDWEEMLAEAREQALKPGLLEKEQAAAVKCLEEAAKVAKQLADQIRRKGIWSVRSRYFGKHGQIVLRHQGTHTCVTMTNMACTNEMEHTPPGTT
ncbi:MAG: hypothetical protein ACREGH_02820 [Minisyncoccia bacterium]